VDAIHEKIMPLPGHVSTSNWTDGELLRTSKRGI